MKQLVLSGADEFYFDASQLIGVVQTFNRVTPITKSGGDDQQIMSAARVQYNFTPEPVVYRFLYEMKSVIRLNMEVEKSVFGIEGESLKISNDSLLHFRRYRLIKFRAKDVYFMRF